MRVWDLRLATLAVAGMLTSAAWGQTASNLVVKAATSKRVDLTWTGTAATYTIQRAPLGGSYSSVGTATSASYSDTTVDAYTTYQYQIVAGSSTSNHVTVGPPPVGLSAPAPAPLVGATPSNSYGYDLTLTLDGNGDPAFAFIWEDPNADNDYSDTAVLFRSWNRAQYTWNPVVKVGVITDSATTFRQSVSLAYDASASTWGIAAEHNDDGSLDLFVSSDGATWTKKKNFSYGNDSTYVPSLALAGGNVYLAFVRNYAGLQYVTGKLSADPATWNTQQAPVPSGTEMADPGSTISLALDSAGNPGIAYFAPDSVQSYNEILLFWRPGNQPVIVSDSQNTQTGASSKLVYYGLNPRILFYLYRADADDSGDGDHYVQSNDGGKTWQAPVLIPPDGHSSTDYPFDMTVGSQGQIAIGFGQNGGSGDATCPNPKLALSTDGVHFTTCAIAGQDVLNDFGPYPSAIQVAYGGNDKLYYLWWSDEGNSADDSGIVMYREPPVGSVTGPVITSVADGASFRPNIVGGSWVTVKGANLSTQSRIWAASDFNNGDVLPTNLSGVQVKVNGVLCAVYYISASQINFQAPANISGTVNVQVIVNNINSNTLTAAATAIAPGLFTYPAGGVTYPAAVFPASGLIVGDPAASGNVVSKAHPSDVISLYATGMMATPAGVIPGVILNVTTPVTVTFTSTTNSSVTANAPESFAGLTAVGEFQINIAVPNLPSGNYYVTVTTGGQSTQTGVVIPIA